MKNEKKNKNRTTRNTIKKSNEYRGKILSLSNDEIYTENNEIHYEKDDQDDEQSNREDRVTIKINNYSINKDDNDQEEKYDEYRNEIPNVFGPQVPNKKMKLLFDPPLLDNNETTKISRSFDEESSSQQNKHLSNSSSLTTNSSLTLRYESVSSLKELKKAKALVKRYF
jgi:hypothetical protein